MPIIPPTQAQPYDTVEMVLNTARVRLNDKLVMLYSTGSTILDNTDAFSHAVFNAAYRRFQTRLAELGSDRFASEVIIEACPILASSDPASQTYIDWFEFFDGVNYSTTPVLPDDFIMPLWISERWTGQNQTFPVQPNMENMVDGFPGWPKWTFNRFWQWRDNKIFMPGSQMSMDLRIGYVKALPDINDVGTTRWYKANIPIVRCMDAMAWHVCYEYAIARAPGDPKMAEAQSAAAAAFRGEAEEATRQLFKLEISKNQRVNVRRIPRNRGARGSWGAIC